MTPSLAALDRRQFLRGVAATGAVAGAGGLLAACSSSSTTPAKTTAKAKSGGSLSCGLTGGSSSDTIDPHLGLTYLDISRILCLYSPLVALDANGQVENVLAESITAKNKNPSEWIIKLKSGVTFHNGQPLTADDVIFTFNRVISNGYSGASSLGPVNLKGLKALDKLTVYVPLKQPAASFVERIAASWLYLCIAPNGFKKNQTPNGTGPFVYKSFTAGQRSVFTKNKHYFKPGLPHVDTLTIIDFNDTTSLQNALVTNVVQAAGTLDGPAMASLANNKNVHTVASKGGGFEPFTMRVDQKNSPFGDVRVRQAMRMLVNRPQLIDSALDGYGTVGNDVFSPFDPFFDHGLQQREQDIAQAKHLLKQAGHENLAVTLTTSPIATATVAMATVFAQQAKAAGVKINLQNVDAGTFFAANKYLNWTFSQDYYGYAPYLAQVAQSMVPGAPFNETHEADKHYVSLYNSANSTLDPAKQKQYVQEMMQFDYNDGGYIIPCFVDFLDAYSSKVTGYVAAKVGQPISGFGYENLGFVQGS